MKTVSGVYTSAKIFTDTIEDYALAQIQMLCDNEAFKECRVRVMPDVHPGKAGTIGFRFHEMLILGELRCRHHVNEKKAVHSLGTLGGGNHFIELDKDEEDGLYVIIHSGSRHLGQEITEHYLRTGQEQLKERGLQVPYELTWLEDTLMEEYIGDLSVAVQFAELNRAAILDELVKGMKWKVLETWSSVHNYIDISGGERILRKGAVSAKSGEKVVIPVNMRDGILLGTGLGNADWNDSAPHGAGRIMKREDVKQRFTVSQFKSEMKGIYCTCIDKGTLDEAPFAYRGMDEITERVTDTVRIEKLIRPLYCYKAGSE